MRLRDICVKLDICEALRLKIWTCVEHSLVHCTDLILDRHLDQILMCAIYVMAKVALFAFPLNFLLYFLNADGFMTWVIDSKAFSLLYLFSCVLMIIM